MASGSVSLETLARLQASPAAYGSQSARRPTPGEAEATTRPSPSLQPNLLSTRKEGPLLLATAAKTGEAWAKGKIRHTLSLGFNVTFYEDTSLQRPCNAFDLRNVIQLRLHEVGDVKALQVTLGETEGKPARELLVASLSGDERFESDPTGPSWIQLWASAVDRAALDVSLQSAAIQPLSDLFNERHHKQPAQAVRTRRSFERRPKVVRLPAPERLPPPTPQPPAPAASLSSHRPAPTLGDETAPGAGVGLPPKSAAAVRTGSPGGRSPSPPLSPFSPVEPAAAARIQATGGLACAPTAPYAAQNTSPDPRERAATLFSDASTLLSEADSQSQAKESSSFVSGGSIAAVETAHTSVPATAHELVQAAMRLPGSYPEGKDASESNLMGDEDAALIARLNESGCLSVTVDGANELSTSGRLGGAPNPYVLCWLRSDDTIHYIEQWRRSRVCYETFDPEWSECIAFDDRSVRLRDLFDLGSPLTLRVYDEHSGRLREAFELLGEVVANLDGLKRSDSLTFEAQLHAPATGTLRFTVRWHAGGLPDTMEVNSTAAKVQPGTPQKVTSQTLSSADGPAESPPSRTSDRDEPVTAKGAADAALFEAGRQCLRSMSLYASVTAQAINGGSQRCVQAARSTAAAYAVCAHSSHGALDSAMGVALRLSSAHSSMCLALENCSGSYARCSAPCSTWADAIRRCILGSAGGNQRDAFNQHVPHPYARPALTTRPRPQMLQSSQPSALQTAQSQATPAAAGRSGGSGGSAATPSTDDFLIV